MSVLAMVAMPPAWFMVVVFAVLLALALGVAIAIGKLATVVTRRRGSGAIWFPTAAAFVGLVAVTIWVDLPAPQRLLLAVVLAFLAGLAVAAVQPRSPERWTRSASSPRALAAGGLVTGVVLGLLVGSVGGLVTGSPGMWLVVFGTLGGVLGFTATGRMLRSQPR